LADEGRTTALAFDDDVVWHTKGGEEWSENDRSRKRGISRKTMYHGVQKMKNSGGGGRGAKGQTY